MTTAKPRTTAAPQTLALDLDDMTVGDIEDFEREAGMDYDDAIRQVPVKDADGKQVMELVPVLGETGKPTGQMKSVPVFKTKVNGKAFTVLVWLALRKQNPKATLEDARAIKVSAIQGGPGN